MAFTSISNENREYKKVTDLKVGESLTGYYLSHEVSSNPQAKGAITLAMRIDGKNVGVSAAGNLKYIIQDGKITTGALIRITRLDDKKVKGMRSSQYSVEQDLDDVYVAPSVNELAPSEAKTTGSKLSEKMAALKANGAATARQ